MINPTDQKAILRDKIKHVRKNLENEKIGIFSHRAAKNFLNSIPWQKHNRIGLYIAIKNELDTYPLIEKLLENNKEILLPSINPNSKVLKFFKYEGSDLLAPNKKLHILEPKDQTTELIPDILVTPLIAFDIRGHRIGFGGGYYDFTIEKLKQNNHNIPIIGYAYEFQKTKDNIPYEAHDQKLDHAVTEEKTYSF